MLELKIWSDYACFTRPENKAERVSYDVMTFASSCLRSRLFLEYCLYKANPKAASSRFRVVHSCSI